MKKKLYESPADQAHDLGLVYLGFAGWGYPDDPERKVIARTVDGRLVKAGDEEEGKEEADLGRCAVLDLDDDIIRTKPDTENPILQKYIRLIKAVLHSGSELFVLHARNSDKIAAKYLQAIGITAGPTLVPLGSSTPEKKKEFVEKKIKEGYSEVQFFDRDPHAVSAVDSLKAPFNKLDVRIDTHLIPSLEQLQNTDSTPQTTSNYEDDMTKAPKDVLAHGKWKDRLAKLKQRRDPEGKEDDEKKNTAINGHR